MKKYRTASYERLAQAACVVCLGLVAQQAVAQEPLGRASRQSKRLPSPARGSSLPE